MESENYRNPNMRLAQAYIPFQHYSEKYSLQEALQKGTLFPELWRPYCRKNRY
ncbi:MAG: spore coat associated protein CotJA [Halanaerobiaceae bacterium]